MNESVPGRTAGVAVGSFTPPARRLMGPGPSDVHPRVLAAMARPAIGHLDPVFVGMMDELKQLLRYAFQTNNQLTFPRLGPGSVGMESCFVNIVEPGDKVVVMKNGVFGGRMVENVERCGAIAVTVEDSGASPVSAEKLEDGLNEHPEAKLVSFVQAETSTGAPPNPSRWSPWRTGTGVSRSSTPSRRWAAARSGPTSGTSMRSTPAARNASSSLPDWRR